MQLRNAIAVVFVTLAILGGALGLHAQDPRSSLKVQSSPFPPPEASDSVFVVDDGPYLDTACLFSGSGPLVIDLEIDRVVGSKPISELIANGVVAPNAELILPAFDVDFAGAPGFNPERDRISLNGTVLSPQYLTGSTDVWKLNSFTIPTELIRFPVDPGSSGTPSAAVNTITIDIDTANSTETWCTAVDWVAIVIEAARPVAFFHGILSSQGVWSAPWVSNLEAEGFLTDRTDLGALDSIQNNANKIATVVNRMRSRWNVDKVNIVSHSKGGLDSRHYVENRDTVERVIQIGTPNAGAPLADYVQIGSAILLGVPETIVIDLALPAGFQLTTWHMESYNSFHSLNPDVKYTAMAGDYAATIFDPINLLIGLLTPGPDDLIVPVASVHALPVADERTHSSSGNDESATHTEIHASNVVYNNLVGTATAFGKKLEAEPMQPLVPRTGTQGAKIASGVVESFHIDIEAEEPVSFTLIYGSGDLDLAVITPGGLRVDASTADGLDGFSHGASEDTDGFKAEGVSVESAEIGAYTLEVTGSDVTNPQGEEPFIVSGWLTTSELVLTTSPTSTAVPAGQPLQIEAMLTEGGIGLAGASVEAKIVTPEDTMLNVVLTDGESGLYSASVAPPLAPGNYRIAVQAQGSNRGGSTFSREDSLLITVAQTGSTISGPHSDTGEDLNANGLFDQLVVSIGLDITAEADFRLVGQLTDASGTTVIATAAAEATFEAGSHSLPLAFDGESIFASRIDGPYQVQVARLAERGADGELLPVDQVISVHETQAYGFADFEHDAVLLTGNGTLAGVDDDSNGVFDRLVAEVEVEVITGGANEWSGRLLSPTDSEVEFASDSGVLPAGRSIIALSFDGCRVRATGQEGTFSAEDLLLFGASGALVATEAIAQESFNAEEFQCDDSDLADVAVALDAGPDPVSPGETLAVDISVFNQGPSPASDATLEVTVSGAGMIDSATASQGVCSADESQVFCSFTSIPADDEAFVSLLVLPSGSGSIIIEASGQAIEVDLEPGDNTASVEISVGTVVDIPTMDKRGMALMALLLAALGLLVLRYRG